MGPKTVESLNDKIEEAVAQVIMRMGQKRLPLLTSQRTMHLMVKAVISVYVPPEACQRAAGKGDPSLVEVAD